MTIKQQRESLPAFAFRDALMNAVQQNQILIVVGETGSGKTTQLTQYIFEAGFTNCGAAMSVAKRVAEEVGCTLGEEVGYSIRFEDHPDLTRYSVIMLDEAHERTIATNVLFALLKKTLKRRSDIKVIITSATLDAEKFFTYFNNSPIFTIPGRTYPVEILYSREPESDYLDAAPVTVMHIHLTELSGHILLFLTGQEEIDMSCEIPCERTKAFGSGIPPPIILPVYSALPAEMQSRIFEPAPPNNRKIVIATNIAETSITIDHIKYVIDPGFAKQKAYDPKIGMDSLFVAPVSQAQANQRARRARRTGTGKCFRLYTETAYQSEMLPSTTPATQRFLTRLGRQIADFPVELSLAKILITAGELRCSEEILSIVAMLNLANVFYRPKDKQKQADQKKASGYSNSWCFDNFIEARTMRQVKNIREQLRKIMERYRQPIISCGQETEQVRCALCTGFFRNAARKEVEAGAGCYKTIVESTPVYMHPSSAIFRKKADWVVYHELVLTTHEYMRWTTSIEPKWLADAAPTFFKVAGTGSNMSKRRKQEQIQPLYNKYVGEKD
ncbi:P-loop containing nucleoside triphosphate hydrolase protein [Xylaria curta]|nr:P-loop containing nucleoside triphosphate hydrolase protein [Xylaria curta]